MHGTYVALYGTYVALYDTYVALYDTYVALYGTYVALYGTYVALYGTYIALYGIYTTSLLISRASPYLRGYILLLCKGSLLLCNISNMKVGAGTETSSLHHRTAAAAQFWRLLNTAAACFLTKPEIYKFLLVKVIRWPVRVCVIRSWWRPTGPKCLAISCYWLIDSATHMLIKIYIFVSCHNIAMSLYNII